MKFTINFKTPDAVDYAISEALGELKNKLRDYSNGCNLDECPDCTDELLDELQEIEIERDKAEKLIEQFVRHEEVISVEFDTDKGTAEVVKIFSRV